MCLRCLLHHILSLIAYTFRENREFVFIIVVQLMMSANIRICFGLQIVLLIVQYTISLSSLCKLIWRHWTYKMPVRYILSSVWVRLSIFSPLSIIHYVGLYVFSLLISLVMIERMHILCLIIIIKSEVWSITHCLGLGHETMVSAQCLSIFSWGAFTHLCPDFKPAEVRAWKTKTSCYLRGCSYLSISWFANLCI